MCGICGYRSHHPVPLNSMNAVLAHRGPDDSGTFQSREHGVGLGHRRLAIIDLTSGHQPMQSADGQVILTYSGEIYNYQELKKTLQAQGHLFRTASDTEVLLTAYLQNGTDCLKDFNGEFAFVLYDKRKDLLFGARDRLGIKPFYYVQNDHGFFFASEIKSLFESGRVSRRVNQVGIDLYFTYRFNPDRQTIYKEVFKLLPGHAFIQSGNKPPQFWRYWSLPEQEEHLTFEDAVDRFQELLTDSIRHRLISDVPIGVYLSGGIDSTTVVAIMAALHHYPIRSYTVEFGTDLDETAQARETALFYNARHQTLRIVPDDIDALSKAIWHMDEPFGDPILVPNFCLSAAAAHDVKVVLTGEGADEGQMGYVHHESLQKLLAFPPLLMNIIGRLIPHLPVKLLDKSFNYPRSMGIEGRKRLAKLMGKLNNPGVAYEHFCSLFTEEERARLYGPGLKRCLEEAKAKYHDATAKKINDAPDPMRAIYRHDIEHWLPDNILKKQDRMAMAHSLEGRVPFLDHRLVEFQAKLPMELKIKNGRGKHLLRCYYEQRLAAVHLQNKKKRAFMMPMEGVYRAKRMALADRYLNDGVLDGNLWNKREIRSIIDHADRSPLLNHKKMMSLVIMQIWQELFKPEWE
jgi:asparagine synthase (glutamine-hydrolysing)